MREFAEATHSTSLKIRAGAEQQVYIQNQLNYEEGCGLLPFTRNPEREGSFTHRLRTL
jgi:hypothetical protein